MLSDREQRGPRWGVAERRVLTQSNRVEVRQFCSWAEQINQLQLPLEAFSLWSRPNGRGVPLGATVQISHRGNPGSTVSPGTAVERSADGRPSLKLTGVNGYVASHCKEGRPIQCWPGQDRGELRLALAPELLTQGRRDLSQPDRPDPRRATQDLVGDLRTLPPPRIGFAQAWDRSRRYRRGDGAQRSRHLRGPFRGPDDRRGAEHAEHPARRRSDRVPARAWRSEGADHRPRVQWNHTVGVAADGTPAAGDRHR